MLLSKHVQSRRFVLIYLSQLIQFCFICVTSTAGNSETYDSMGPNEIIGNPDFKIPRKIVAIGNMDSNWGWGRYTLVSMVMWISCDTQSFQYFSNSFLVVFVNKYSRTLLTASALFTRLAQLDDSSLALLFCSTYFLNRTVPWFFSYDGISDPFDKVGMRGVPTYSLIPLSMLSARYDCVISCVWGYLYKFSVQ